MANEAEAQLLQSGVRAGLIDPAKGTAALVVYTQMRKMGAAFSFGEFLVERGLLSRIALDGLERNLAQGGGASHPVRTVSVLGDFELLETIGEGQSGAVFKAHQLSLNRNVALKIFSPALADDPEALERFTAEAKLFAQLRHPHIVQFIRMARAEGLYYIAMELVEGGSIRTLIAANPDGMDPKTVMRITRQVASALSSIHKAGLLHQDVKPENILISADGNAKLADLGIASAMKLHQQHTGAGGEFWGTPGYVAPEIITGRSRVDGRSDLYGLGAVMFEMLTGLAPFSKPNPEETLRLQLSAGIPDLTAVLPNVHPHLAALVERLLEPDPAARFPDAGSIIDALDLIHTLKHAPVANRPAARRPGTPARPGARPAARPGARQPARPGARPVRPGSNPAGSRDPRKRR